MTHSKLKELIQEAQWGASLVGWSGSLIAACPWCGSEEADGAHDMDCRAAKLMNWPRRDK